MHESKEKNPKKRDNSPYISNLQHAIYTNINKLYKLYKWNAPFMA